MDIAMQVGNVRSTLIKYSSDEPDDLCEDATLTDPCHENCTAASERLRIAMPTLQNNKLMPARICESKPAEKCQNMEKSECQDWGNIVSVRKKTAWRGNPF